MEIVEDKALLLRLRNPSRVLSTIKNSKQVDDHRVVVRWGVEEVQRLRQLGLKPPSPIRSKYNWPGQMKPFDHQRETAEFLTMHKKAFCFNEQGTGKTASAIWAADYLMKLGLVRRALVLCPLSIMDSAWRNDLFACAMHRSVDVAYGPAAKRKRIVENGADFVIINYDGLGIIEEEVANGGFDLYIVDEATHYKTATTKRWKLLNKLVGPDDWLWMMTGTPAAQNPTDAYGLAKLVNRENVPRTFGSFRDMVMWQRSRFKWEPKETAKETVHEALQPAIRFTKEECLDLPDMVYTQRHVELTRQQAKYYKLLKEQMVMQAAEEQVTSVNAAVNMNKLLQISAGAVYTDEGETLEFDVSNRYAVLKETIDEASHKVLVFVPFRHTIQIISEKLRNDGISTEIISGGVKASDRTQVFDDFQNKPDPRVLIIQPQAAAHGVTLTAADTIVWWAPTASLETYLQANARVHRSGQHNKCTVVQLQGSPVEKKLFNMLQGRVDVHSKLLDLYKEVLD